MQFSHFPAVQHLDYGFTTCHLLLIVLFLPKLRFDYGFLVRNRRKGQQSGTYMISYLAVYLAVDDELLICESLFVFSF